MNLIDILNRIHDTKREMKSILNENDNIARYSISIHNLIAKKYNEGYSDGYSSTWEFATGQPKYTADRLEMLDYDSNDSKNYNPWTMDGLCDIMSDVLNYRYNMKEELNTESDFFPSYPDILKLMLDDVYERAKEQGSDEADIELNGGEIERPEKPRFIYEPNQFRIESDQPGARLYYIMVDKDGRATMYTGPVTITETVRVYYYAKIGNLSSFDPDTDYYDCVYNGAAPGPSSKVDAPDISLSSLQRVIITAQNINDVVYYSCNGGKWSVYTGPFFISDTTEVRAYAMRDDIVSPITTRLFTIDGTDRKYCPYPTYNQSLNSITLECPLDGAQIYYRIGAAGNFTLYTAPINVERAMAGSNLYCYATYTGYENSQTKVYVISYMEEGTPPEIPQMYMEDERISGHLHIWTPTANAILYYRIGNTGEWIRVDFNHTRCLPSEDCTVYAYAEGPTGLKSDMAVYKYTWYSKRYSLPTPELYMVNNRVYVRYPEDAEWTRMTFTTDGREPTASDTTYSTAYNRSNIVITEPNTVVKVRVFYIDGDNFQMMSKVATGVFSPVYDDTFDYSFEYFTVQGASEIQLSDIPAYWPETLSWSYDKENWTQMRDSVTGLDRSKKVYLKGYGVVGFRGGWKTMTFGEGDKVTISGNIISLIWPDSYTSHNEFTQENTFRYCFKGCTQLVDATNLIIPITNSLGGDYEGMFEGCINLESGPNMMLPCKVMKESACKRMFYGCSKLRNGLKHEFTSLEKDSCKEMYTGCESLAGAGTFNLESIGDSGMEACFKDCKSLTYIQLTFTGDMKQKCFKECFSGCSSLDTGVEVAPGVYINGITISSSNTYEECCAAMFSGCTSMTGFGSLPARAVAAKCYREMFKGCRSLKSFGSIGATDTGGGNGSRSIESFYSMFEGCTSLEKAPALYISGLNGADWIYGRMFYGCSSLNYIKAMFLDDPYIEVTDKWLYTQDWVNGVAEFGTFEMDEDAKWFRKGVHAIPEKWVVNAGANTPGEIISITCDYDTISITADPANSMIQYSINNDTDWRVYNGPFIITQSCYVYARCYNNKGLYGAIKEAWCELVLPGLTITKNGVLISIEADSGYEYDPIYYIISYGGEEGEIRTYDGPFVITGDCEITAWGIKPNGEQGGYAREKFMFTINKCDIECYFGNVTITCNDVNDFKSYGYDARIEYILGATWTEEWIEYDKPFHITRLWDVTARAKVYLDGKWVYGPENTVRCDVPEGGLPDYIPAPVFMKWNELQYNNIIWCPYEQLVNKDDRDRYGIRVMYSVNGGEFMEWELYEGGLNHRWTITEDVDIECYAIDNEGHTSVHAYYSFKYDALEGGGITVPKPVISVKHNDLGNGYDSVMVTCSDGRAQCFMRAVGFTRWNEWSPIGSTYTSFNMKGQDPESGLIEAYAIINPYKSEIATYEWRIVQTVKPEDPVISFNPDTNIVTITAANADKIYYSLGSEFKEYTGPFEIYYSCYVTAYAANGNYTSGRTTKYCTWTAHYEKPEPPVIIQNGNNVIITGKGKNIWYRENGGQWKVYNGEITITGDTYIEAYVEGYDGQQSDIQSLNAVYTESVGKLAGIIHYIDNDNMVHLWQTNRYGENNIILPDCDIYWGKEQNDPWNQPYIYSTPFDIRLTRYDTLYSGTYNFTAIAKMNGYTNSDVRGLGAHYIDPVIEYPAGDDYIIIEAMQTVTLMELNNFEFIINKGDTWISTSNHEKYGYSIELHEGNKMFVKINAGSWDQYDANGNYGKKLFSVNLWNTYPGYAGGYGLKVYGDTNKAIYGEGKFSMQEIYEVMFDYDLDYIDYSGLIAPYDTTLNYGMPSFSINTTGDAYGEYDMFGIDNPLKDTQYFMWAPGIDSWKNVHEVKPYTGYSFNSKNDMDMATVHITTLYNGGLSITRNYEWSKYSNERPEKPKFVIDYDNETITITTTPVYADIYYKYTDSEYIKYTGEKIPIRSGYVIRAYAKNKIYETGISLITV